MVKAIVALVVGVLALVGADWVNANYELVMSQLLAAVETAGAVLGFFGVSISLGTLALTAVTNGLHSMSTTEVQAHAATAVAGAVLLAAAGT